MAQEVSEGRRGAEDRRKSPKMRFQYVMRIWNGEIRCHGALQRRVVPRAMGPRNLPSGGSAYVP